MIFSATGRAAFARVSVVVIRPCSKRLVTRFRNVARRCHGLRPSFDPDFRCRIRLSLYPSLRTSFGAPLQPDRIFGCRRRRRLARQRRPDNPAVLVELHAEAQTHFYENVLDLVERLPAEVLGLQHFVFALLHELADSLNIRVLEAVVRAHGEVKLLHRAVQVLKARIVRGFDRQLRHFRRLLEVDEDTHVVLYQLRGQADGILRRDRPVGPDLDHQLFVVGHLAETRRFDRVVHLAHRGMHAVDGDVTNRQVLVVIAVCRHVAAAVLRTHLNLQLSTLADRRDVPGGLYLDIKPNREAAARYGIDVGEVQNVIETAIGENNITTTIEGRRRFPVRVRYAPEFRSDPRDIANVLVTGANGAQIPLEQVADIRQVSGPAQINSENGLLEVSVLMNARGRDAGSVIADADKAIRAKVKMPPGSYYT